MHLGEVEIPPEVESIYKRLGARYVLEFEPLGLRGKQFQFLQLKDLEPLLAGRDIFAQTTDFPFWAKIWESSVILADFLAGIPPTPEQRVLELGAGLGVTGVVGAAFGHRITITDYRDEILDFVRVSAAVNRCEGILFSVLDWADPTRELGQFDLILGSEILFHERFFEPLLKVFKQYLAPNGTIYMAHDVRRKSLGGFLPMCEADYHIGVKKRTLRAADECVEILLTRLSPR